MCSLNLIIDQRYIFRRQTRFSPASNICLLLIVATVLLSAIRGENKREAKFDRTKILDVQRHCKYFEFK